MIMLKDGLFWKAFVTFGLRGVGGLKSTVQVPLEGFDPPVMDFGLSLL